MTSNTEDRRIGLLLPKDVYDTVKNMADKRGVTLSSMIRTLITDGLNESLSVENINFVANIVRRQADIAIQPHINRIAALVSKAGIMSATSTYLCAQAVMDFVPVDRRRDAYAAYETARKKAVKYFSENDKTTDGFIEINE